MSDRERISLDDKDNVEAEVRIRGAAKLPGSEYHVAEGPYAGWHTRTRNPRIEMWRPYGCGPQGKWLLDGAESDEQTIREVLGITEPENPSFPNKLPCILCTLGIPDIHAATRAAAMRRYGSW